MHDLAQNIGRIGRELLFHIQVWLALGRIRTRQSFITVGQQKIILGLLKKIQYKTISNLYGHHHLSPALKKHKAYCTCCLCTRSDSETRSVKYIINLLTKSLIHSSQVFSSDIHFYPGCHLDFRHYKITSSQTLKMLASHINS